MLFTERVPEKDTRIDKANIPYFQSYLKEIWTYKKLFINNLFSDISRDQTVDILEYEAGIGKLGQEIVNVRGNTYVHVYEPQTDLLDYSIQAAKDLNVFSEKWFALDYQTMLKKKYDLIICMNNLHHWQQPECIIQQLLSMQKDDGVLVINDLKRDANEKIIEMMLHDWKARDNDESNWFIKHFLKSIRASYTKDEIITLLKNCEIKDYSISEESIMSLNIKIHYKRVN